MARAKHLRVFPDPSFSLIPLSSLSGLYPVVSTYKIYPESKLFFPSTAPSWPSLHLPPGHHSYLLPGLLLPLLPTRSAPYTKLEGAFEPPSQVRALLAESLSGCTLFQVKIVYSDLLCLPLSPSLTPLQPRWPPRCSSKGLRTIMHSRLCACRSFSSFRPWLRHPLLSEAFPDHLPRLLKPLLVFSYIEPYCFLVFNTYAYAFFSGQSPNRMSTSYLFLHHIPSIQHRAQLGALEEVSKP